MTTRTELVRRLDAIGDLPTLAPTERFIDELEARLVNDVDDVALVLHAVAQPEGSARVRRPLVTWSGLAAAIVVVVGIAVATLQVAPTRVATPGRPAASPSTAEGDGGQADDADGDGAERDLMAGQDDGSGSPSGRGGHDEAHPEQPAGPADGDAASSRGSSPAPGWSDSEPSEARFRLEASSTATGADLEWDAFGGDDFFVYIVLRSQGEDPEYPRGDNGTQFVHRSTDRGATTWSDTNPTVTGETRYIVLVFDEAGQEVARSNVAAVSASVGLTIKLP